MKRLREPRQLLASAIAAMLMFAACGGSTKSAVRVSAAPHGGSTSLPAGTASSVTNVLDTEVTLNNGSIHLLPSPASDTTAVTDDSALSLLNGFVAVSSLTTQPIVFLARYTDDVEAASPAFQGGNGSLMQYQLKNTPVVAVLAAGPPQPSGPGPEASGAPPATTSPSATGLPPVETTATYLLTIDAQSGKVLTFLSTPDAMPRVSLSVGTN